MAGIKGKVALITGAGSGIGEATALMLAERDAKVATGSDRLKAVGDRIVEAGGEAAHARTDVRRRGDVTNLINLASERSPGFEGKYPSDKFLVPRPISELFHYVPRCGCTSVYRKPSQTKVIRYIVGNFPESIGACFQKKTCSGSVRSSLTLGPVKNQGPPITRSRTGTIRRNLSPVYVVMNALR